MRVLCVLGTRPEAIKLAPVIAELKSRTKDAPISICVCVTAQHRELLDQLLPELGIFPDKDLNLMRTDQQHALLASAIIRELSGVIDDVKPDVLLVQGDTTTVAAAAMAGFYKGVRVAHVEAGLRTFDRFRPYPEEVNRRVVGATADYHFAATSLARNNLRKEGVNDSDIYLTGNPVIDTLRWVASKPAPPEVHDIIKNCRDGNRQTILMTVHRRESFGRPLARILHAVRELADRFGDDVQILYPVHPNPRVLDVARAALGDRANILLLPPLGYFAFVHLLKASRLVITDSGGIQEEAPTFGKPVVIVREVTERPEAVEAGVATVAGTESDAIIDSVSSLLTDEARYSNMSRSISPFGDGEASWRIASALLQVPFAEFDASRV